jgi:hypothetical protein
VNEEERRKERKKERKKENKERRGKEQREILQLPAIASLSDPNILGIKRFLTRNSKRSSYRAG